MTNKKAIRLLDDEILLLQDELQHLSERPDADTYLITSKCDYLSGKVQGLKQAVQILTGNV